MRKKLAHCAAVVALGTVATLLAAWHAAGYSYSTRTHDLHLPRYGTGVQVVYAKVLAGDKKWAGVLAVDTDSNPPTAYYSGEDRRGWGRIQGGIDRYPITSFAATELLRFGATPGTERRESTTGTPPRGLLQRATHVGQPDQIATVLYWGWVLPLVRCDLIYSKDGVLAETSGLVKLDGGDFLPFAPVWPGFSLSVALSGGLLWSAAYGTYRLIAAAITRKYRAIRERYRPTPLPTVACPGCGYARKGLPSIEPCPECGLAGPAQL